jgi:hypothetical protein
MKGRALASAALLALIAAAPLSAAVANLHVRTVRIRVTPSAGAPASKFVVSFRTPDRTGRYGSSERRYELSASVSTSGRGCITNVNEQLPAAPAHARVRVTLNPRHFGGKWCKGEFHGQVEEILAPVCPQGRLCPAFVLLLGTIGKFRFEVKPPPGNDRTAPSFGGLKSAFACTPGPQRPGETTPFSLSWSSATDDVSSPSAIVYDIYMSNKRGGEDFSRPTWTSRPGVTSFRTPGLPSHGTFYFVVRAKDRAGNEEHNKVERLGVDRCL